MFSCFIWLLWELRHLQTLGCGLPFLRSKNTRRKMKSIFLCIDFKISYRCQSRTFIDSVISFLSVLRFVIGNSSVLSFISSITKNEGGYVSYVPTWNKFIWELTCQMQSFVVSDVGNGRAGHFVLTYGPLKLARSLCLDQWLHKLEEEMGNHQFIKSEGWFPIYLLTRFVNQYIPGYSTSSAALAFFLALWNKNPAPTIRNTVSPEATPTMAEK